MKSGTADTYKKAKKLQGKKDKKGKSKIANKIIEKSEDKKIINMKEEISTLRKMAKNATIDDIFVPNKLAHLNKWAQNVHNSKAFTSDIEEEIIIEIMLLKNVENEKEGRCYSLLLRMKVSAHRYTL